MTKKDQPFVWTPECQEAFEALKTRMTKAPILVKADHGKIFILETDASQNHVGAVLMQYSEEGLPRVIAYFSKKLRPAEVK